MALLNTCIISIEFLSNYSSRNTVFSDFVFDSFLLISMSYIWSSAACTATYCISWMSGTKNIWCLTFMQYIMSLYGLPHPPLNFRHHVTEQRCGPFFHVNIGKRRELDGLARAMQGNWSKKFWRNIDKLKVKCCQYIAAFLPFSLFKLKVVSSVVFQLLYFSECTFLLFSSNFMVCSAIIVSSIWKKLTSCYASSRLLFRSLQRLDSSFFRAVTSSPVW